MGRRPLPFGRFPGVGWLVSSRARDREGQLNGWPRPSKPALVSCEWELRHPPAEGKSKWRQALLERRWAG